MPNATLVSPSKHQNRVKAECYHCHDEIKDTAIYHDEKNFCCEGCKTVYQILNENDMCTYYALDANAGISQKGKNIQYAYLDDAEVIAKIIDFQDETTTRVTFLLPQMHCASCIWLLENLYKITPSVFNSKVNFLKKEVTVLFSHNEVSLRQVAQLLASVGYAPEINFNDIDNEEKQTIDRTIYYKLGVAGFAFGNIMLLSFPEYLGLGESLDKGFAPIFGYINLVIAIPVLLYSSRDYLISAWQGLKHGYLNIDVPLSLGIVALFGRSAWEILSQTGAGYMDSFAALIFLLLTGKWFQQKTYNHLSFERDYKSYFPVAAHVKKEGNETSIPLNKLEVGEIIVVRNGELIPADGIILRGYGKIDYSFVTGEAEAVTKQSGDKVFAGGRQMGEAIEVSLTRKVSQSYLTELWNNDAFKTSAKSHISYLADRAGRYFTGVILVVSMVAFLYWLPQDTGKAINAATAVLIIACPCAVALAIPFTMGNILRILGRHEFYLKNTNVIENFERVDAIVFDKTGTITQRLKSEITYIGETLTVYEEDLVKSLTQHSSHPLSRQLNEMLSKREIYTIENFQERVGEGIRGIIHNRRIKIGSAAFVGATGEERTSGVFIKIDNVIKGHYEFKPNYRKNFADVLLYFKEKHELFLLSGDNDKERGFLNLLFDDAHLHFNQTPNDKLNFIKNLQSQGKKVLMVGDGLNDAGALQQANIGVVVSENTNNFSPACDAILQADKFSKLPAFLELSRAGSAIVNNAYLIALCYNIVGLSYAVMGQLQPVTAAILMPLSSATIVLFGVLSGNWKAQKLKLQK